MPDPPADDEARPDLSTLAAPTKSAEPVVENSCDASWSSEELVSKLCDMLVASGKIRSTPAFIRTDREAKLVKVFTSAGIDGAKMGTLTKETLKITIRNATQGEGGVDDVQTAMITFLPAEAQLAKATVTSESEELKKVRTEVAAKRAERAAREQSGEGKWARRWRGVGRAAPCRAGQRRDV